MKIRYDPSTDIFYLLFKEGPSHEVVEAGTNVMLVLVGLLVWGVVFPIATALAVLFKRVERMAV